MTQKDKQLLLKDLCARLPYGIIVRQNWSRDGEEWHTDFDLKYFASDCDSVVEFLEDTDNAIPYLRPLSSMTEEEKENLQSLHDIISNENYGDGYSPSAWDAITEWEDYCNSRHLDYRGLIEKGLALEALEGMYKNE